MMLYFLGIATGAIGVLVREYKVNYALMMEEDETNSSRLTQNLIEEDVICHSNYFTLVTFKQSVSVNSNYTPPPAMDVSLSMVVPPPERA